MATYEVISGGCVFMAVIYQTTDILHVNNAITSTAIILSEKINIFETSHSIFSTSYVYIYFLGEKFVNIIFTYFSYLLNQVVQLYIRNESRNLHLTNPFCSRSRIGRGRTYSLEWLKFVSLRC